MCSIFERGVPLGEHIGSRASGANRVCKNMRARLALAQRDDLRSITLGVCVEGSREGFVYGKQLLALSRGITTGPPV